jgi:hypothetical protein
MGGFVLYRGEIDVEVEFFLPAKLSRQLFNAEMGLD